MNLEIQTLLSEPPEYWDYSHEPPNPVKIGFFKLEHSTCEIMQIDNVVVCIIIIDDGYFLLLRKITLNYSMYCLLKYISRNM